MEFTWCWSSQSQMNATRFKQIQWLEQMPEEEKEVAIDCTNPDVVTKYRLAGDIAAATLQLVLKLCKNGAKIVDICSAGAYQLPV